jgi:8-oxo-dGTP diphosphatase
VKTPIRKLDTRRPHTAAKPLRHVVAALILRGYGAEREVLICQRRPDQPMGLKWEFPGGKIEADETAEAALVRELQEELGIEARVGKHIVTLRHTYRNGSAIEIQFFQVLEFTGEIVNRIFRTMQWAPFSRLPEFDFLAADLNLIRDLASGKLL